MIETSFALRILIELVVVLICGIIAFFAGWQWRQDKKITQMVEELVKIRETYSAIKGLAEHNIPDAWKEADKSKDLLIDKLTLLCMRFCEKGQSESKE